ncbi:uroporphyrinogen-III C-methyltransferase [Actinopolymorpha pittospori]|uniref:Uroporphyrin-III C-methyltransferase/precorrin-2 dehydrogenase/sirohydrochlorin ferrochelatase n=1 Tax=Actinopolymorpha pittospori TaxID=648752 RepID=A0A927N1R1_9ACTN|nr:uroporphyrinogen-III C-methyltransferase [Actinopolymorpha pittospori]MBE1610439.1 uroporphyrin-III C-methyltransferase/precorrin-2 dehydrogenase/sirohydrochlorin ferrochelatase [Actinopolymorpha pittospori]
MSPTYPLVLDLDGRRAVVVGGGPVGARRTTGLLEAGAIVTVVAPALCEDLAVLVDDGRLTWLPREYAEGDLAGAWLVQAATADAEVNATVAADAERAGIWCVRADDARTSAAWTPATARVDDITVAVSASRDPRRARAVKDRIAVKLQTGELPLRRVRRKRTGHVALVGGGPGDPGLITTRGRRLLADADVVVVDRLAPRALLDELDPEVEVIEAGKGPQAHTLSQLEINDLLVERARAGQRVVRLKGGDPFVFGRGAEEALACAEAGIPCEVVPGVTSAVAVPAAAGIPVTHRGVTRQFTVISAHSAHPGEGPDWASLAAVEGTLVFLMGVSQLPLVVEGLRAHGRSPATPVAVIERGTLADQRTTTGTLETIVATATERGVRSPAVIIVGEVVTVAEELATVVRRP